jgi:hypothetical protein
VIQPLPLPSLRHGCSFIRLHRKVDAMPVSDLDINRSAHLWIQQHGDQALAKAREIVETMRRKGDEEGADTWLRIYGRDHDAGDAAE